MARKLHLDEDTVPMKPIACIEVAFRPGGCYARHFHRFMRRDLLLEPSEQEGEGAQLEEELQHDDWF